MNKKGISLHNTINKKSFSIINSSYWSTSPKTIQVGILETFMTDMTKQLYLNGSFSFKYKKYIAIIWSLPIGLRINNNNVLSQ